MASTAQLRMPVPERLLTSALLTKLLLKGGASEEGVRRYAPVLVDVLRLRNINTGLRIGHFLAQIIHESIRLTAVEENLNYSEQGLRATFPKRVTKADAKRLARRPEAIANHVYASRYGNGSPASGDGWRYRGRGLKQVTFLDNYRACRDELRRVLGPHVPDFVAQPQRLAEDEWACHSAGWYWGSRSLNAFADKGDTKEHVRAVTVRINGGTNGLDDRIAVFARVMTAVHHYAERGYLL